MSDKETSIEIKSENENNEENKKTVQKIDASTETRKKSDASQKSVVEEPCLKTVIEDDNDVHIDVNVNVNNQSNNVQKRTSAVINVERKGMRESVASQTDNDGNIIAAGIQIIVSSDFKKSINILIIIINW